MLQLLGIRGALELFTSVAVSMLFALGTSKYAAGGNISKLAFLALGLTLAFGRFGLHEALWVLTLAPVAQYVVILFGLKRHCALVIKTEIASFATFAITAALAMLIAK
jgi:hypothetical protein